jgi:hypothetical protein
MPTKRYCITWKDLTEETFNRISKGFDAKMLREMLMDNNTSLYVDITYGARDTNDVTCKTSNGIKLSDIQLKPGEQLIQDEFVGSTGTGKLYETTIPHDVSEEDKVPNRYFVKLQDGTIQQRFTSTGTELSVIKKDDNPALSKIERMRQSKTGMKYQRFTKEQIADMVKFTQENAKEFGGTMTPLDIRNTLGINNSTRMRNIMQMAREELAK